MPRIRYDDWSPKADALEVIGQADAICRDYAAQGYDLTLRQLYYQFVARGLIANNQREYKRLGSIVNNGRLAGLLDWDYIVDRTRNLESLGHWASPGGIIAGAARSYHRDLWVNQPTRVEVWVEKEALAGVVSQAAEQLDCAWFSCRGYVSQSELWGAAQRLGSYIDAGQNVVIVHLGDHDPSGIDMTRDIEDRLSKFVSQDWLNRHADDFPGSTVSRADIWRAMAEHTDQPEVLTVDRIALNWDQVEQYNPPPNPAKVTDSRAAGYIERHGRESWELDALEPQVLSALITAAIEPWVDDEAMDEVLAEEAVERRLLKAASRRWAELVEVLDNE